jgi:hypothetical protein
MPWQIRACVMPRRCRETLTRDTNRNLASCPHIHVIVMRGHSASRTRVNALLSRASTSFFAAAWNSLARTLIRPHGEEARARHAAAMLLMFRARAVSNHEGGRCEARLSTLKLTEPAQSG